MQYIKSPLNYTGGKYKLLNSLFEIFPNKIDTFVDLFAGGFNVGINVTANTIICNDHIYYLIDLYKFLQECSTEEVIKSIKARIDEYVAAVCAEKIEQMKIPVKQNSWSNEVTYISMSEFIGERYEKFLNERRLNERGEVPNYSSDKKYSVNEYLIRNYLGKELEGKVADMIQKARSQAEETVFKTLEQSLKENLAAETIERMNIPQILKNMQKQNEEFKQIGDSNKFVHEGMIL